MREPASNQSVGKRSKEWAVLFALLPSFLLMEFGGPPEDSSPRAEILRAERPECPRSWDTIPILDKTGRRSAGTLTFEHDNGVAGPTTNIPEFNDCQKFITADGTSFDSLFAIFAAFRMDTIAGALGWDTANSRWSSSNPAIATVTRSGGGATIRGVGEGETTVTARSLSDPSLTMRIDVEVVSRAVGVGSGSAVATPRGGRAFIGVGEELRVIAWPGTGRPTTSTRAAATIYTYGPGYAPLGIRHNFNCLYLYFDSKRSLRAKMVHVPSLSSEMQACLDAVNPQTAVGTELRVDRITGFPEGDYPAVARWDWGWDRRRRGQQFIGIACGAAWCEIGRPAPPPAPEATAMPTSWSPEQRRVRTIKGWYDEQLIAVYDQGSARPGRVMARVYPAADLDSYDRPEIYERRWVLVAEVEMRREVPGYRAKLNLTQTSPGAELNQIFECHGSCLPERIAATATCTETNDSWWAMIISAAGDTAYYCVVRKDHSAEVAQYGIDIPGTARWRWLADDETIWKRCIEGCCEVEEEDRVGP